MNYQIYSCIFEECHEFVSIKYLAKKTRRTVQYIWNTLRYLEAKNLIKKEQNENRRNGFKFILVNLNMTKDDFLKKI